MEFVGCPKFLGEAMGFKRPFGDFPLIHQVLDVIPPLGGPPFFVVYPNVHGQDLSRDIFPNIFACFI